MAQSVRQQARLGVGYDGKDALRWTLSVSRKGQAKPLRVLSGKSLPPTLAWDGRDKGGKADALCFDVTDAVQTRQALERLQSAGPVQVLVNNAGTQIITITRSNLCQMLRKVSMFSPK
jgi:NAD(P)-dependent dehydrogenase (short-subunit alcohol dehydrogenase family)